MTIIRFKDYRTVENYGNEIYKTDSFEDARQYMKSNENTMRFLVGGGKRVRGSRTEMEEIYWDVVSR